MGFSQFISNQLCYQRKTEFCSQGPVVHLLAFRSLPTDTATLPHFNGLALAFLRCQYCWHLDASCNPQAPMYPPHLVLPSFVFASRSFTWLISPLANPCHGHAETLVNTAEERRRRALEAATDRLRLEEAEVENSCGTAGPQASSEGATAAAASMKSSPLPNADPGSPPAAGGSA